MSGTAFLNVSPTPTWGPWLADAGLFAMPEEPPVKIPPPTGTGFDVPDGGDPSSKPVQPVKTSTDGFAVPDDSE